jgi:hypothetical protein
MLKNLLVSNFLVCPNDNQDTRPVYLKLNLMLSLALNPFLCLQYALNRHVCMQTASGFHLILISLLGTLALFLQAKNQLCL